MTAKTGQKCTAIRRAIVPQHLVDPVIAALKARLEAKVVPGDPRDANATMGPLVSVEQREDAATAVRTLVAAGGDIVLGGPDELEGAFFAPTILRFADSRTPAVHNTEAFGPVVSFIGYDTPEEAIELAALGAGSLVASVITHDPELTTQLGRGIAAHHGRLHFLDRDDAKTSTGHGSPLPHLVHGGPGRAGGGEELGGVRGIKHFMQRTAIQGTPDHLTAITGQWHRGARVQRVTRADVVSSAGVHPFRKDLATLKIGDQFASDLRKVSSRTSPRLHSQPVIPSTPTPTKRPPPRTPSSHAASHTVTSWSPGPQAFSWSRRQVPFWRTTAWRTCALSPRLPTTIPSASSSPPSALPRA